MPWKPLQQRAIAADLSRRGKSDEEISRFFRAHGHGGKKTGYSKPKRLRKKKRD